MSRRAVRGRLDRRAPARSANSRHITLPGLSAVIATALLLRMIWGGELARPDPGHDRRWTGHRHADAAALHAFPDRLVGAAITATAPPLSVLLTLLLLGVVIAYVWRNRA